MVMRYVVGAVALVVTGVGGAAAQQADADWLERCDDRGPRGQVAHCEVRDVPVRASGSLELDTDNGIIEVCGADRRDVSVRARIRAYGDTPEEAEARARAIQLSDDDGRVDARGGRGQSSVDYVANVPRSYDLRVSTANGPITVCDVTGRIRVETANGPAELREVGGEVQARTANGPLTLELAGTTVTGSGIDLSTANGPLTLVLSRGVNAQLRAGTGNGPLSSDLDLPVQRTTRWHVGGSVEGVLGSGGGDIRATTSNGPLTIRTRS